MQTGTLFLINVSVSKHFKDARAGDPAALSSCFPCSGIVMWWNTVRLYPTFYLFLLSVLSSLARERRQGIWEGTVGGHRVSSNILEFLTLSWIGFNVPWRWSNEKNQKKNIHLPNMTWQCVFIDKSSSRNELNVLNWMEGRISVNIAEGVWGIVSRIWQ